MHRNLLLNLLRAVYWYADAIQLNMDTKEFARSTRATTFLLLNIAQGEHRASSIARNLGISRQAVSQMVADLCSRGLLTVREDPNNRSNRIVSFSPAFAEYGAVCAEIVSKLEAEIKNRVGAADYKAMVRALDQNWGATPAFKRLSRTELAHGKKVWREEFDAENADGEAKKPGGSSRTDEPAQIRRRGAAKRLGSASRKRRSTAAAFAVSPGRRGSKTPPNR